MAQSEKNTTFFKFNSLQAITVIIALVGLLNTLGSIWLVAHLAPITKDLAVVTQEVQANTAKDNDEHPTFVTKDMFAIHQEAVKQQYQDLSQKLDWIQARLGKN